MSRSPRLFLRRLSACLPRRALLLAPFVALLAACGQGPAAEAASEATAGGLVVSFRTSPEPAVVGPIRLDLHIESKDGRPIVGAEVQLDAWMEAHGHGLESPLALDEVGEGDYRVEELVLPMSGQWTLFVAVEGDGFEEEVELVLAVE